MDQLQRIRRVLIANRGEIAARIIRSAQEMDILTVAVFSEADRNAPYVKLADLAIPLPGNSPKETYLNQGLIIDAAKISGCDAIHPGYGFLSENAEFASACGQAGIIFIGPTPRAIALMGSKIEAKRIMAEAGVPVLAGITVSDSDTLSENLTELADTEVGYPVLVKAAFGGGGRGMRVVHNPGDLLEAIEGARREAASAFGNGTVFLEHYVESPRHIEVQIFGDSHGEVVHLFERECSIQRRYQKIIEESPSPAVSEELRSELGASAVAAAKAIGYVGAGTVEFVMDNVGKYYFLEVNTRLQVEHPVTEMVTGLDLVRLQILVAEGMPLPDEVRSARINGHAIEVRIYAEDVLGGFLPSTGVIHHFHVPDLPGIRLDSGVKSGGEVSVHYDSMVAKVISHGKNRDEARRRLARALSETRMYGVANNVDLLLAILRESEFKAGAIDTGYLVRHTPADLVGTLRSSDTVDAHCIAAAIAVQASNRSESKVLGTISSGWRNVPNGPQTVTFKHDGTELVVRYRLSGDRVEFSIGDGELCRATIYSSAPDEVDFELGGIRRSATINRFSGRIYVADNTDVTTFTEVPRFQEHPALEAHGSLVAPMPGTVVRIAVDKGSAVSAGDTVVVLEAMKMEHSIKAPVSGIVQEIRVDLGQSVDIGLVLAIVEDPT